MHPFTHQLEDHFAAHQDAQRAVAAQAYMKGLFPFLGISAPDRRALQKSFFKENAYPDFEAFRLISKELWAMEQREYQYVAMEMWEHYRKQWTEEVIGDFEQLIVQKSWWDTVDVVASHLVGAYFVRFPHQKAAVIERWMQSDNMWLQRTCLIFQLSYKGKTDVDLLLGCCLRLMDSKEFFIQKAIGWALRQYARTDSEVVRQFVSTQAIKPLSRREALKHIQ